LKIVTIITFIVFIYLNLSIFDFIMSKERYKIYLAHSTDYDFVHKLYEPIKDSTLIKKYNIIFPHEANQKNFKSLEVIKSSKIILAEVSYPSIGLGIELGWANISNIPILCFYESDKEISKSLKYITNNFCKYTNASDMIQKLDNYLTIIIKNV
jgi:hypothetical protein